MYFRTQSGNCRKITHRTYLLIVKYRHDLINKQISRRGYWKCKSACHKQVPASTQIRLEAEIEVIICDRSSLLNVLTFSSENSKPKKVHVVYKLVAFSLTTDDCAHLQGPANSPRTNYWTRVSPTITSRRFISRAARRRGTYFSHLSWPWDAITQRYQSLRIAFRLT